MRHTCFVFGLVILGWTSDAAGVASSPPTKPQSDALASSWRAYRASTIAHQNAEADAALSRLIEQHARSGWPKAQVYADALTAEVKTALVRGDLALAESRAEASLALSNRGQASVWTAAHVKARQFAWGPAARLIAEAIGLIASEPEARYAAIAGLALVFAIAWCITLSALTPFVLISVIKPMVHFAEHMVPRRIKENRRVYATTWLALMCAALIAIRPGPLGWASILLCLSAALQHVAERQQTATLLAMTALVASWAVLPVNLWQHDAQPRTLRLLATEDATASWARQRLYQAPQGPARMWSEGLIALAEGDPATASVRLGGVYQDGVIAPELDMALGAAFYQLGDFEAAEQALRRVVARRPSWADAKFNLSQALLGSAQPVEADKIREESFRQGGGRLLRAVAQRERGGHALLALPRATPLYAQWPGEQLPPQQQILAADAMRQVFRPFGGRFPRTGLVILTGLLSVFLGWPQTKRQKVRLWGPKACQRCGDVICGSCGTQSAKPELCSGCAQMLAAPESMPHARRLAQQVAAQRFAGRRSRMAQLFGALIPGAGLALEGRIHLAALHVFVCMVLGVLGASAVGWLPAWAPLWLEGPGALWPFVAAVLALVLLGVWLAGRRAYLQVRQ